MTTNPRDAAKTARNWRAALACVVAALPLALVLRGFTVDDALVTARVASRLSFGEGYRFNAGGPEVDAVTPYGFAQGLAFFGPAPPLAMLERARDAGLFAWLVAAGVLGWLLPGKGRALAVVLPVLAVSAPLAAWASSGMETGAVTLLATLALVGGGAGAIAAGLAAAWRPELLVFAVVLAGGDAWIREETLRGRARRLALGLGLVLLPVVAVALLRQSRFGSAVPLAVLAKPSDLAHGFAYAATGFVFCGAPLLLLAPRALREVDGGARLLTAAVLAHFAAVTLAGGDWMALCRLLVPALPAALLAGARLAEHSRGPWPWVRVAAAVTASVTLFALRGIPARSVLEHRSDLIARASPLLEKRAVVAALDVGWVTAATNANLLDLAGITDPLVARLPGGHTSKRIPEGLLEHRDVDTLVLLLAPGAEPASPWTDSIFARAVENRLATLPALQGFTLRATLPLGGTQQSYVVLERPPGRK
jgi:hypothetical protein